MRRMDTAFISETVQFPGHGGDTLEAYAARPLDETPRGGVAVIHHLPGYDRETKEFVRRFADAARRGPAMGACCPPFAPGRAVQAPGGRRGGRGRGVAAPPGGSGGPWGRRGRPGGVGPRAMAGCP